MRRTLSLLMLAIFVTACGPAYLATPVPTSTPKALTSTPSPSPTSTLIPPTIEPEDNGDVLTREQQERLWKTSQTFLADSQEQALKVAERINYVQYPDPSNMCGPLAIAELQEAGLLNRYIEPHDFWLLRPEANAETIRKTFPPDRFENYRFSTSIGDFDFKAFPLKVGDLLYLYAGDDGTFEHILTVTRLDEQGRAYSVTNLNTQPYPNYYYVIKEVMLYDPNQPDVGQFQDWTDETKNNWIGLTGFGGFEVWRFSRRVEDKKPEEAALADEMDAIFEEAGGEWRAIILDLESDRRIYDLHSNDIVHVASVIKVPVAMLVFASLEKQGVPPKELVQYIETHGNGSLLSQLLHDMLVDSDEKATEELLAYVRRSGLDIKGTLAKWGGEHVDVFNRTASLEEMASLLAGLYRGDGISAEARGLILEWMAEYTPNDDTRLGVIRSELPEGAEFYNKRGSITAERLVIGDAGILAWQSASEERVFVIVIFGYPGETSTNDLRLVAGLEKAAMAFWEYAK